MTGTKTEASNVEYRAVLADPASNMILAIHDGAAFRLPRVHIPKWTRPAEEITRELREKWSINAVILKFLPSNSFQPMCVLAEVANTLSMKSSPLLRVNSVHEIVGADLDLEEQDKVTDLLSGNGNPPGPFSRRGWLKEAQTWIQDSLPDRHIEFANDFRQYNAGDNFALVRFDTCGGPAYWLKATGEPNRHEFVVTSALSELFPQHLPILIGKREDWNAWVTEDAGEPLGGVNDLRIVTGAVEAMADLQILSLDYISPLKKIGCIDRRLTRVQSHLLEMVAFLEAAMSNQTSTKVKPLTPQRVHEIGAILDQALDEMRDLDIPDSLVNGDINLDNILYRNSYRFTDWAEAGIGNPFLTLQQIIQHVIREGEHLDWIAPLCSAYRNKWNARLSECQIDRALALMPLITMADYLYGRGDWINSPRRDDPSFQGFARTLGRCMDRAASELQLIGAEQS